MAIFAPKCDRCGQRTRNKEQGRPMCEGCLQQMQLMLDNQKSTIEQQNQRIEADTASIRELQDRVKAGTAENERLKGKTVPGSRAAS